MKLTRKLATACLTATLAANAAGADLADHPVTFSFDNGDGLSGTSIYTSFTSRHGAFLPDNGTPVSQFFVHQDFGAGAFHYGGTASQDEHHYYGGMSFGGTTLAYFQGEGERFSKAPNALYDDLNHYFFHGGTRSPFAFRGVAADVGLPGRFSARLAATDVTAPGVEDRHGYYAGLAAGSLEAGIFRLQRGDQRVGGGLDLSYRSKALELKYQEIRSEYDARVRRMALAWNTTSSSSFSVELEQANNDLFSRDDEQRIMLRIRKRFGRAPAFNAAEEGSEAEKPGFGRAVGIGVGLGVAAIAVSSGSGGNDSASRFTVRDQAAFAVFNRVNPISVRQNREHGGWIYRNADNTFGFTQPVPGTVNSVNIGSPLTSVPMGTVADASYHTHGGPDPRFINEEFSPVDLQADRLVGLDGYLGTPAGFMKLHDVETGNIIVVGRIRN